MADTMVTAHEADEVKAANATGKQPVVFVHGLWLLPSSWDRWATLFNEAGYVSVLPHWPDDPETVAEANARSRRSSPARASATSPTTSRTSSRASIARRRSSGTRSAGCSPRSSPDAVDRWRPSPSTPAPFRGVLPLPISALKSAFPVLGNPLNRNKAVPLTYEQFRFAFANVVDEAEARELHETFAVPAAGKPLFQAASANLNPWTEAKVDTENPERGPLLLISGEKDNTVPWSITKASYDQQSDNEGVTEVVADPESRPLADHRQRLAGGRRDVARVRQAFRLASEASRERALDGFRTSGHGWSGPALNGRQRSCNGVERGMARTWNVAAQTHDHPLSFLRAESACSSPLGRGHVRRRLSRG